MKSFAVLFFVLVAGFTSTAYAEEGKRQLEAHVHGHGALNISTEGKVVLFELEAPSSDIVGFEQAAETPEQKEAVKKATGLLKNPLTLFVFAASANCRVENAKVEFEKGHAKHGEESHSEVHAQYALYCENPLEIKSIDFKYFTSFPSAQELEVSTIGSQGQKKYEVKRDNPVLDLGGSL